QQLPITLSSQQYQTLIQNQNSNQQILLPTQYLTNTHGQMVQTLISTSSTALNDSTTKIIAQQTNHSRS
ncbi:hypothetical protein BLA29_006620, partial [Euroglyphus maynei]